MGNREHRVLIAKQVQLIGIILLLQWIVGYCAYSQSIKIATTSERDSLVFKIKLDNQWGLRIFFEDRLYADLPPFAEKTFAIQPQLRYGKQSSKIRHYYQKYS
ncbi:MAG: hypothetical protein AAF632_25920 [Bacteroidota bacterium]